MTLGLSFELFSGCQGDKHSRLMEPMTPHSIEERIFRKSDWNDMTKIP